MSDTITLYALDSLGQWTGLSIDVDPGAGWAWPWIYAETAPPALAEGEAAVWAGGAWYVQPYQEPPAEPDLPAAAPLRISKIDFSRLFTAQEFVAYLALEAQTKALAPADFADPDKVALVQAAAMFKKFDMLPDLIELDHPETIAGVGQVLVATGVLTEGEAARILANVPPPADPPASE